MKKIVHPIAGVVAMVTIATFWISTALSEAFGSTQTIVAVKSAIPWGFLLLVPALAATGGSGFALAKGARGGLIGSKLKRMPFIAANGLLILIPSALYLASKAKAGQFDGLFYGVQVLELLAGPVNLALLGLNMRDGLRLTGKIGSGKTPSTAEVAFLGAELVADGTMAFRFAKPQGFQFEPGQWAKLTLINPTETDKEGNSRTFTIASAPHVEHLLFVTRFRDTAFKRTLKAMKPGTKIRLTGPGGEMVLPVDSSRPVIFLAGGIGVTPFLSMVRHATKEKLPHRITLFYSNRQPKDAAYLAEFQEVAKANPSFRLIATMTGVEVGEKEWTGETGVIDIGMIGRSVGDLRAPIYFCAGPAAMVGAMKDLLLSNGVASADIRTEEFYGY